MGECKEGITMGECKEGITMGECKEGITMGECKEQQSKHTVINYPMGVIPEFGNSMLFGRYSFPTKSCLIVLKHFLLGEETTSEDNHW